jgi:hypothetical protein
MLQIYVYDDTGNSFELDLYESEPMKLTLSAEEIKDIPRVNSAFSKAFRIPATQKNSRVFQWWYEVNTVDFDVTRRVRADIYVDGLFYKSGHIRIDAAYVNETTSQVDLEVVFFGETRDFASQIGEITLNQLNLTELNHELTIANVQASWAGTLANKGIRYALAERGYDYDDSGVEIQDSEIAQSQQHNKSFQKSNHPLDINQLTPMVQVKRIIDSIFEQTEYTYSANSFFNTTLFEDLYTDGIPRAEAIINQVDGRFRAESTGQELSPFGTIEYVEFSNEITDPSNSYFPASSFYFVPEDGTYTIGTNFDLELGRSILKPSPDYRVRLVKGATILADTGVISVPVGLNKYTATVNLAFTGALTKSTGSSDAVNVQVEVFNTNGNNDILADGVFECTAASVTFISVSDLLKYDVKCLDFFKSILTKFKLIMAPSADNEFEFEIMPWKDYIASGDRFDWTKKMDVSKDIVLKPIFFEQSQLIDFKDVDDEDRKNKPFFDLNGRTYGALQFDSTNDLLKDTKTVTTVFAPTPIDVVEGFPATSEFVIPFFSKTGEETTDHGHLQHLPMRVKPRLLFWNGLAAQGANEDWYYWDSTVGNGSKVHNTVDYPRMTPYSIWPTTADTINLNWFRDETFPVDANLGKSVYEEYWNVYIQQLYSPYARILSAYFNLSAQDLREISFDDIIFIKNSYWRILKIYDAPLTETSTVKVDLVKLLDYKTFANNGDPSPGGGGIDYIDVTGGGGTPIPTGDVVETQDATTGLQDYNSPAFGSRKAFDLWAIPETYTDYRIYGYVDIQVQYAITSDNSPYDVPFLVILQDRESPRYLLEEEFDGTLVGQTQRVSFDIIANLGDVPPDDNDLSITYGYRSNSGTYPDNVTPITHHVDAILAIDGNLTIEALNVPPAPTYYYHLVQPCANPGDLTYVTRHDSLIAIGDSVKMSGSEHVDTCYEVIAHVIGPEDTVVLETFPDCFSCNE